MRFKFDPIQDIQVLCAMNRGPLGADSGRSDGAVEEVADAVVMLTKNGSITGQTINLSGAWYMS